MRAPPRLGFAAAVPVRHYRKERIDVEARRGGDGRRQQRRNQAGAGYGRNAGASGALTERCECTELPSLAPIA